MNVKSIYRCENKTMKSKFDYEKVIALIYVAGRLYFLVRSSLSVAFRSFALPSVPSRPAARSSVSLRSFVISVGLRLLCVKGVCFRAQFSTIRDRVLRSDQNGLKFVNQSC